MTAPLTEEALSRLEELLKRCTQNDWSPGHLRDDSASCNCAYIFADNGRFGCIATVEVDNGKSISDGGNDGPPLEEAKANQELIPTLKNMAPALLREIRELRAANEGMTKILDALSELDCRDSMCFFAKDKSGQRSNGGCCCLYGVSTKLKMALHHAYWFRAKTACEAAGKGAE
jgi:hypothetical protein